MNYCCFLTRKRGNTAAKKYFLLPFFFLFLHCVSAQQVITSASFGNAVRFATSNNPDFVAAADLDGDGRTDLVTTNYFGNSISVLKNTGNGTVSFAAKTDYPTGLVPRGLAIGDLDGDAKPDIAVVNNTDNTLSIFRNTTANGVISFAARVNYPATEFPYNVAIADLDGDGKKDIVVSNNGTVKTVSVFKNISTAGNISFAARTDFVTASGSQSISTGDIDGDGKPDIAVANFYSSSVSVLRNNSTAGTISFDTKVDLSTDANPFSLSMADIDGDGKTEISVCNQLAGTVSVFKNRSTGGSVVFDARQNFTTGTNPCFILATDLNADGKPDVVTANPPGNLLSVLQNTTANGTISFGAKTDFNASASPQCIVSADIDKDGKPDLVTADFNNNTVSVFRNMMNEKVPVVTGFFPDAGLNGNTITITGSGFTGTTFVTFGVTTATSYTVVSDSIITAIVGTGSSGSVSVMNSLGTATKAGFYYIQPPTISSFTPASAGSGIRVTINGANFPGVTSVKFGGVEAASFARPLNAPNQIWANVGAGASGNITVTNAAGTATIPGFIFLPSPKITSFTPTSGGEGTTVTIAGKYFTGTTAVKVGGTPAASFTVVSDSVISILIGVGSTGKVSVTTTLTATDSLGTFTYTSPTPPLYCKSLYDSTYTDTSFISNFKLNGELGTFFDNNSGWTYRTDSIPWYSNYTTLAPVKMAKGISYEGTISSLANFSKKPILKGSYSTIWIDFNDNGKYDDNERLLNNLFIDSAHTTFSIFIPSAAQLGYHTMRIRNVHYDSLPGSVTLPCNYYPTGEVEEYRIQVLATPNGRIITPGTPGVCTPMVTTTISPLANNSGEWVPILDTLGNLVAALNANGNNLGTVRTQVYINNSGIRKDSNTYYLDRNIQITPSIQPVTNVSLRIYLLASELNRLINTPGSGITNISQLNMTKNSDNCSSFLTGQGAQYIQTGSGSIGSDYYVEFSIPSFSSFYMRTGGGVITNPNSNSGITVYPNPVKNGSVKLKFNNMPAGNYSVRIINSLGQIVISKQINYLGSSIETIGITKLKGPYIIEIIKPGNSKTIYKLIIN